MTLEKAVKELYYWQYNKGEGTNFHSILFTLFQKADPQNRMKLEKGFPEEATALALWYTAGKHGDQLFIDHGLMEDTSGS